MNSIKLAIKIQLLIILILFIAGIIFLNQSSWLSLFLGAFTCFFPSFIFYAISKPDIKIKNMSPKKILKNFYIAECLKIGILVTLCILSIFLVTLEPFLYFISFCAVQFIFWISWLFVIIKNGSKIFSYN